MRNRRHDLLHRVSLALHLIPSYLSQSLSLITSCVDQFLGNPQFVPLEKLLITVETTPFISLIAQVGDFPISLRNTLRQSCNDPESPTCCQLTQLLPQFAQPIFNLYVLERLDPMRPVLTEVIDAFLAIRGVPRSRDLLGRRVETAADCRIRRGRKQRI